MNNRRNGSALEEAASIILDLNDPMLEMINAERINKKLKTTILENCGEMSRGEIKAIVDLFYQVQRQRIALREQIRSIERGADESKGDKANAAILNFSLKQICSMENNLKRVLEFISSGNELGRWLLQIIGIGPTFAAGLLANFELGDREYASSYVSYAGLADHRRPWLGVEKSKNIIQNIVGRSKTVTDDMVYEIAAQTQWRYEYLLECAYDSDKHKWSKDALVKACAKVPYNRNVKKLMHLIGDSFIYQSNNPKSLYGREYSRHKTELIARNDAGEFKEYARKRIESGSFKNDTIAKSYYEKGKLPPAHINARASRWVQQIFLNHFFEESYRLKWDRIPAPPYALVHFGDQHNQLILPEVPFTKVSSELG